MNRNWWCYRQRPTEFDQFKFIGRLHWDASFFVPWIAFSFCYSWQECYIPFMFNIFMRVVFSRRVEAWLKKHYSCTIKHCRHFTKRCECNYDECPERRDEDTPE